MPEKDHWEIYNGLGDWVILGAKVIPLPPEKCPDQVPDWVVKGLPKNPTPYHMPVFLIDQMIRMKNGRRKATIYMVSSPTIRLTRDLVDLEEKWRPAPPPIPEEPGNPVVLSRNKRDPVI